MQQEHLMPDFRGQSSSQPANEASAYRKVLRQATAAILAQNGYEQSSTSSLETLTQLMETYLLALSEGTKHAFEVANRTKASYNDVMVSLANLGVEEGSMHQFLFAQLNSEPLTIQTPKIEAPNRFQQSLQVGKTRSHPPYIADGLPPFPDPHTYIRTEISGDPEISYDKVREYASEVARESRKNLLDLMQRQFPRICLFEKFHEQVREQAQQWLDEQRRSDEKMIEMRREAIKKARIEKELQEVKSEFSGELTDEILEDSTKSAETTRETLETSISEVFGDQLKKFERRETVKNLVAKRLPPYCFVLDPQTEFRPYLSCLVTEDGAEEGNDLVSKKNNTALTPRKAKDEEGNTIVENAYLRPPRIPSRYESQMEE